MNILISNLRLNHFAGSEIWTYHVVEHLLQLGHNVDIYTQQTGDILTRLFKLGATPMINKKYNLAILNHYDCIEDITKMNDITIENSIQTCHGIFPPPEQPHRFVNKFFAISQEIQTHLSIKNQINSTLAYNPVNLRRFKRTKPVNDTCRKVLILCVGNHAQQVCVQACKQLRLYYEIHSKWKEPVFYLENKINEFDLCIGYGRGIIESVCCGRNVLVYDSRKYTPEQGDGLLNQDNFEESLSHNFSGRATRKHFGVQSIIEFIGQATKKNADWIYTQRNKFDVETIVKKYLS